MMRIANAKTDADLNILTITVVAMAMVWFFKLIQMNSY